MFEHGDIVSIPISGGNRAKAVVREVNGDDVTVVLSNNVVSTNPESYYYKLSQGKPFTAIAVCKATDLVKLEEW